MEDQLHAAESRCQLLEKQLDYMRKMVHNAESDRNQALERTRLLEQQSARQQKKSVGIDQDKLDGLERQHVKLSASQALTEVGCTMVECEVCLSDVSMCDRVEFEIWKGSWKRRDTNGNYYRIMLQRYSTIKALTNLQDLCMKVCLLELLSIATDGCQNSQDLDVCKLQSRQAAQNKNEIKEQEGKIS